MTESTTPHQNPCVPIGLTPGVYPAHDAEAPPAATATGHCTAPGADPQQAAD